MTVLSFGSSFWVTEVALMRTDWTKADETADTLPAPSGDDAAECWIDTFLAQMRDADHQLAILLADDFATAGDL